MAVDKKSDKIGQEQVDLMLKLMLLQKTSMLKKLDHILNSDIPPEDKFQQLAELINPIGDSNGQ